MKMYKILVWTLVFSNLACNSKAKKQEPAPAAVQVEVQGHRGDRGNFPENSLPAFRSAVSKGVEVVELDLVISADRQVVVSHEPYMSSLYVLTPTGDSIPKAGEESFNLYQMSYDSIRKFDAGSKGNLNFPQQQPMKTHKPLLKEVIDSVEAYITSENLPAVKYNIELKSQQDQYGITQPHPEEFVELVMQVLQEEEIPGGYNLQSFDVNILRQVKENYPEVELAYLVSAEGIEENLELLGFVPAIYSPHYSLVRDSAFVDSIRTGDMKLIPWTVNENKDIQRMLGLKVDGIITDFPERVVKLRGEML